MARDVWRDPQKYRSYFKVSASISSELQYRGQNETADLVPFLYKLWANHPYNISADDIFPHDQHHVTFFQQKRPQNVAKNGFPHQPIKNVEILNRLVDAIKQELDYRQSHPLFFSGKGLLSECFPEEKRRRIILKGDSETQKQLGRFYSAFINDFKKYGIQDTRDRVDTFRISLANVSYERHSDFKELKLTFQNVSNRFELLNTLPVEIKIGVLETLYSCEGHPVADRVIVEFDSRGKMTWHCPDPFSDDSRNLVLNKGISPKQPRLVVA